jgi:hypothetical protein
MILDGDVVEETMVTVKWCDDNGRGAMNSQIKCREIASVPSWM